MSIIYINPYRFSAPWTPAAITTALWLDAADASTVTTVSGAVSQWNDKSGNGRNVSQVTESMRPSYNTTGLNGKPTLDWGRTLNNKTLNNTSTYNPARIYGAAHYQGGNPFSNYTGLCSFNFTVNRDLLITANAGTQWFESYPVFLNGGTSSGVALPAISTPFIFATDASPSSNRTNTYIGSDRASGFGSNRGWIGTISEIIILPAAPGTAGRQRIEGYLAHKWGLTTNLPNDHPYKSAAPTL